MFSLRKIQSRIEKLEKVESRKEKLQSNKVKDPTFLSLASRKTEKKYSDAENIVKNVRNANGKKNDRYYNRINSEKSGKKSDELIDKVDVKKIKSNPTVSILKANKFSKQRGTKFKSLENSVNIEGQRDKAKRKFHLLNHMNPTNDCKNTSTTLPEKDESFDLHKPMKQFKISCRKGEANKRKAQRQTKYTKEIASKNKDTTIMSMPDKIKKIESNLKKPLKTSKKNKHISGASVKVRKTKSILKKSKKLLVKNNTVQSQINDERGIMDFQPIEPSNVLKDVGFSNENDVPYFYRATSNMQNSCNDEENDIPYFYGETDNMLNLKDGEENSHHYDMPYIDASLIDSNSIAVIMKSNSALYLQGSYYIKLLLGGIIILGYEFNQGERQAIFSHPCNAILPIQALDGECINNVSEEILTEMQIPAEWIKYFEEEKNQSAVVVLIERYVSSLTSFLKETKFLQFKHKNFGRNIFHRIDTSVVEANIYNNRYKTSTFIHEPYWDQFAADLEYSYRKGERFVLVICGGKNAGKSTFFRFLANKLLKFKDVQEVNALDLDPGQSEFSIPGSISLCQFSSPLLGPSFVQGSKKYSYKYNIFYGEISVQNALPEYISVVSKLVQECSAHSNCPLIVNTMGFTQNAGLDIIVDILRIVNPTRVVNLESKDSSNNFAYRPDPEFVNTCKYGISTKNSDATVNYEITYMFVAGGMNKFISNSRWNRELQIISYLSRLWKETEGLILGDTCKSPIILKWNKVAIHVFNTSVPASHILQILNGSLVALCHVNETELETLGPLLPKRIQRGSKWVENNICHGYGIVQGIDPLKRHIHILTPLNKRQVAVDVNVLIVPKINLPDGLFKFFSSDNHAPYIQDLKR